MAEELSEHAKARKELIWGMYTDVRQHSRHAETLRSNVVNFMIVVASVLIAAITNDRMVQRDERLMCAAVALVGLMGLAFAASYTELHERNRLRAMRLRKYLDDEFFAGEGATIEALLGEADGPHESGSLYQWTRRITGSTQRFWLLLPGVVFVAGLWLTIAAF
jgi:hypothetical protein